MKFRDYIASKSILICMLGIAGLFFVLISYLCSIPVPLMLQNSKLRRELRRADNLTETILTYAKLRTVEKDMQISITNLRSICNQAIREEMELLIAANISISVEGEATVYTDAKMMVFMLKQLLINCSKYCPDCQITITVAGNSLTFADNGPGIPTHELHRVNQRGFTGAAWRKSARSTGMGLFIVSEICKQMNISLEIDSREHEYTRFVFCFLH